MKKTLMLVSITLLAVSFLSAQEIGLKGVGGGLGYATVSFAGGGSSTESVGGFAISGHAYLGDLIKNLGFYPELQYLATSKDVGNGKFKVSQFGINANVLYAMELENSPVKPYAGAGLGLEFVSGTAESPVVTVPGYTIGGVTYGGGSYGGSVTSSYTRLGINLMVGGRYQLNPNLTLFLEPRYSLISDFNQFVIKVGATYALK
jgi:opacity protein-like surface antigen